MVSETLIANLILLGDHKRFQIFALILVVRSLITFFFKLFLQGILYLIYRWLSAILFLAVLSCSLLDIGRTDEPRYEHHYAKWWIYLTHWGLVACAVQAWLGAWIVTQGMMVDRDDYGM